jgi:methionyl-tRNA formyltransferase
MNNLFIGDYLPVLEVFYKKIPCVFAIIEKKNINSPVFIFCKNNNIPLEIIETTMDLKNFIHEKYFNNVIVASFGLILPYFFLDKCKRVFNFHPGDVYTNRGRHPLPNAIKRLDSKIAISVHEIDSEKIDKGRLFAQYFIALDRESSYECNYSRLLKILSFLTEELCLHLSLDREIPLWNWSPEKNSYLERVKHRELESLISLGKVKDFL